MEHLRFVAVEGPIGVGKTSLAKLLARELRAKTVLEEVDQNPFLSEFYQDRREYAFQTQVFFLLSRYRQQKELVQIDLFTRRVVTDYIFAKDKIFAYLNLDDNELSLYEHILPFLERDIPIPDLVIYLQSSPERLMRRIRERGRPYEKPLSLDYLRELSQAYTKFFFHYTDSPLLVVNVEEVDFVKDHELLKALIEQLRAPFKETRFWVPSSDSSR